MDGNICGAAVLFAVFHSCRRQADIGLKFCKFNQQEYILNGGVREKLSKIRIVSIEELILMLNFRIVKACADYR